MFQFWAGNKTKTSILSPPLWSASGELVSDAAQKASLMASTHFPNARSLTRSDSTSTIPSVPTFDTTSVVEPPNTSSTQLSPITMDELEHAVSTIKIHKAAGPDGISPGLLKMTLQGSKPFRSRFLSLANRVVVRNDTPSQWKHASIVVFPKLGNRDLTLPKSYRPISLLCVASKLIDYILSLRVQAAVHSNGQLTHQYGNIAGVSAVHAVGLILHKGREALQRKQHVGVVTIDVSNAFNNLDHSRLLTELDRYGLGCFRPFLRQWLSDRSFSIQFEGHTTSAYHLGNRGIPQGSPLSPILWSI